ncbi:DNA repair protein XRCC4 [Physcomitrium patens]|uniref:XRCC4 N-terminal domain-containing protein n=1 Tax=Physcomitrium patens TaxID=3218 RepID=A0A2K1JIP7_PHYPA|nr:DNA repair protein XRCC4-like [Physcomitrium patens]XP_024395186.1 DNA repair protein XRCC4-like [Physcomitrium patens]XP_024395187.1 DNA repair protein XRCC4-like [Physcomitrium patens]PNR41413.1 hypothetical protein PHYPA_018816 [Physcomitrium patens]|eukprot:XP_024395185.1 DNA repair protein XRCC4-like [Physcomitrella patens]
MAEFDNKTCTRLEVQECIENRNLNKSLFVKSEWKPTRLDPMSFFLFVSDGQRAWTFDGSESFVKERAEAWDKKPRWVMEKIQFYLSVAQPGVNYRFTKIRDLHRKLSFDVQDKESDLYLTANLSMLSASDPERITCDLLEFLHDSNCRLTESFLKKCRDYDRLRSESEVLVEQNKRFKDLKSQTQEVMYKKFVAVLNSKKAKLKELKKELEHCKDKQNVNENNDRGDTTSSSDDEEDESDHQLPSPSERFEGGERSGERLISLDARKQCPIATSAANVVHADPDATQPILDEIENDFLIPDLPPKDDGRSSAVSALLQDTPYTGLPRKRRRN